MLAKALGAFGLARPCRNPDELLCFAELDEKLQALSQAGSLDDLKMAEKSIIASLDAATYVQKSLATGRWCGKIAPKQCSSSMICHSVRSDLSD